MSISNAENALNTLAPLDRIERVSIDEKKKARDDFLEVCFATHERYSHDEHYRRESVDLGTSEFRVDSYICLAIDCQDGSSIRLKVGLFSDNYRTAQKITVCSLDGSERAMYVYGTDDISGAVVCEARFYDSRDTGAASPPLQAALSARRTAAMAEADFRFISGREVEAIGELIKKGAPEDYWDAP